MTRTDWLALACVAAIAAGIIAYAWWRQVQIQRPFPPTPHMWDIA